MSPTLSKFLPKMFLYKFRQNQSIGSEDIESEALISTFGKLIV